MTRMTWSAALVLALALAGGTVGSASAQTAVTRADIQRLQDGIASATHDVAQLRTRDAVLASELQAALDEAQEETIYLKVKLRKHEPVARADYAELRDGIDRIQLRARGDDETTVAARDQARRQTGRTGIPDVAVGTEFDVRLQNSLSSDTAQVEDSFEATTMVDLKDGDRILVPAGSVMRGVVRSVEKAGRLHRKGSLTVAFDRITIRGRSYAIRATVEQALESEGIKGEVGKIGVGAGVGAVIGGILGGVKGALGGILVGAGGIIAATEGKDVELPVGTILRVRLDAPFSTS